MANIMIMDQDFTLHQNGTRFVHFQDIVASSAEESANVWAEFCKTVYSNDLPMLTDEATNRIVQYDLIMPLINVSVDEVYRRPSDLDSSKGPGPDGLSPMLINQCAEVLALPASLNDILSSTDPWAIS